jgi:hypothetical protein
VPELKNYYEFCFEDRPDNPLVEQYEAWLDVIESFGPGASARYGLRHGTLSLRGAQKRLAALRHR